MFGLAVEAQILRRCLEVLVLVCHVKIVERNGVQRPMFRTLCDDAKKRAIRWLVDAGHIAVAQITQFIDRPEQARQTMALFQFGWCS
jgi:hypothetical protein